jgi:pyrroline-5-carboxylate reductase
MHNKTIAFIGGGNMAAALIGGLIANGGNSKNIWVSDPAPLRRDTLGSQFGINTCSEEQNGMLAQKADVLILAVKPQVLHGVCSAIAEQVQQHSPLIMSVAAGIRLQDIERWLGGSTPVIRTMPNTPALVQSGATALTANTLVTTEQRELAEGIMRAVGMTLWLESEQQMDAVTALSGSGPAYLFLVIEVLAQAGTRLGLAQESAQLLALQTAFGAAKMALESSDDCATLRQRVTSPGGTTEKALAVLEENNLRGIFEQALEAARDRSIELADMLGRE